jgi:hypothetical protein
VQQRRLEDRIRSLCAELLRERDHLQIGKLSGQLRSQLHTYVEELRKQFAVYPGVQAYRRETDAIPNAPPVPHIPEAAAPSPVIHPKPEVTMDASGDKNGPGEMKAS